MQKSLLTLLLLTLFSGIIFAQQLEMSESELMNKLDSILQEGNLLYKYEKATWVATDLAYENPIVKAEVKDYLTYEEQGEIRTIILGENLQTCIAEYTFEIDLDNPTSAKIEKRELFDKEKTLVDVRKKILNNINDSKYGVVIPPVGYGLNYILLPFAGKYKLYIITGTTIPNIVPFGNDYIFIANENGEIESWQKFHSILIPSYTIVGGNNTRRNNSRRNNAINSNIKGLVHTHLPMTPLITATDICTFMLYAPFYDNLETLTVVSHFGIMRYSLKENKITVEYFR